MAFDILVLGGGPAGVVTAKALTGYGYRVALLTRPRRRPATEGLSERAIAGLRFAGCQQTLSSIGPEAIRQAQWNGEGFTGNREWLIERPAFDAALQADARAAGIALLEGRAGSPRRRSDRWTVTGDSGESTAAFLIEARGRAAPHGRNALQRSPVTIALGRCWEPAAAPATRVAAFAEGWVWFAGTTGGSVLQFFISAHGLPPRPRLEAYYQRLLTAFSEAQDWLGGARPRGEVFARYAQPQINRRLLEEGYARVGDAAFAIDPLSGHGIYQAVSGALALAATVNTLLAKPQDRAVAEQFYREKIETDFQRMARIGRDFYRLEQRWPEHPFWRERRAWPDGEPAHSPPDAAAPRIAQRPVNRDGWITLQEVIVTADHPRGLWQVAGVPLVPLLRDLDQRRGEFLAAIAESYALRHRYRPEDCRTALAWLASRRLLTAVADPG